MPADVDVLDSICQSHVRFHDSFLERVKIYCYDIYSLYVQILQLLHMLRHISSCQDTAVYCRVQSLYSAIQTFREACHV